MAGGCRENTDDEDDLSIGMDVDGLSGAQGAMPGRLAGRRQPGQGRVMWLP
jgi:hypothetical protein